MKLSFECMCCGFQWEDNAISQAEIENMSCAKIGCRSSDLKVRDLSKKELEKELRLNEQAIDDLSPGVNPAQRAKAYVCLADDWFRMGTIEEGQELINKAHAALTAYFEKESRKQMANSPTFAYLMNGMP